MDLSILLEVKHEDLLFMKSVFQKIQKKPIHIDDILKILKEEPELLKINENTNSYEGYLKSLKRDKDNP